MPVSSLSTFGSQLFARSRTPSSGWATAISAGKSPALRIAIFARSRPPTVLSHVSSASVFLSIARTSSRRRGGAREALVAEAHDAVARARDVVRGAGTRLRAPEADRDGIDVERRGR